MENENKTPSSGIESPKEEKRHLSSAERQQIYAERASERRRAEYQQRKKERKKKIILFSVLSAVSLALIITLIVLTVNVFIPAGKYANAEDLCAKGKYLEAYDIFSSLNYKDSATRADECIIKNAQALAGREEVRIGTSASMPWFRITPDGAISFDDEVYKGDATVIIPDVFNDILVRSIGNKAFAWSHFLEGVIIPPSVEYIGEQAFFACDALVSVELPDAVRAIGEKAFSDCTALKSVKFGSALSVIGARSFFGCTVLTSVTIPEGVSEIGYRSFNGCTELTAVSLPSTVTNIGGYAFTECKKLSDVTYNGTLESLTALCSADGNNIIIEAKRLITKMQ